MPAPDEGRTSRESRVRETRGGVWGSSSQDFVHLAEVLYRLSAEYARRLDGNCSVYALAGIPMLLSALRCLLIELNSDLWLTGRANQALLADLATSSSDIRVILTHYTILPELRERLELLVQVRHEILHPAHRPSGDTGNTPAYLQPLREASLLQSTGEKADYIWLEQLKSHRLFRWAFQTVRETVAILVEAHQLPVFAAAGLIASYS